MRRVAARTGRRKVFGDMYGTADQNILVRTDLFRGLSPESLRELRRSAVRRRLAPYDPVFHQGDPAETFYIVAEGRLRVTQTTADGQQVIIRYIGPTEVAGLAVLAGDELHPSTATAVADSEVIGISRAIIREVMARHPEVAMNAVSVIAARYREMQQRLRELSTQNVERRIAHTVLRLAQEAGRRTARGIEIAFPLSRQDLAEMTGTTLHTVSRVLSAWESRGLVDSGRRRVVVRRPHELALLADAAG